MKRKIKNFRAHEVSERNRMEYEAELNLQKIDNIKAREQMDAIKQFEEQFVSIIVLKFIITKYYFKIAESAKYCC